MCWKMQGIIIRKRRQELGWLQTELCSGICAASYLSKIEQGKAEGSAEVRSLLLRRLGIEWRDDPEFMQETAAWFEDWYDRLFSGEEIDELAVALSQRREEYQHSPFFLDWLLLTWLTSGKPPVEVQDFVSVMDERQNSLYLSLTGKFSELLKISGRSYFLLEAGKRFFYKGDFTRALSCFQRGMDQAYREGSVRILMECCGDLACCYSCLNQLEQAREYFTATIRITRSLGRAGDLELVAYNLASTELQLGHPEDAVRHLLEHPWNQAMYFLKLSTCYERLGQREKALQALEQARTAPLNTDMEGVTATPGQVREIFDQMCCLANIRLNDTNYLKNPEYGKLLHISFRNMKKRMPESFFRFHAAWLEEWYVANRQYQKAHEILGSIFQYSKK